MSSKMSVDKRKRSANWLPSEKLLLLDLVEKRRNIIVNKKTDTISNNQKFAAWKIIAELYNRNTRFSYHRSAESLRSQWESMKTNAKREAKNKLHQIPTGGGPEFPKIEDEIYSKVMNIIKTSAVGLSNPIDNDAESCENAANQTQIPEMEVLYTNDQEMDVEVTCITIPAIETDSKNEGLPDSQNLGDYTPKRLKTPDSTPLCFNRETQDEHSSKLETSRGRRKYKSSSLKKLREKKMEAIQYQISVAELEEMRLAESQELDIEIKKEHLKQEKIKTRILLLDLRLKKKELKK